MPRGHSAVQGHVVDAGLTEAVLGSPRDPYTVALMAASKLESLEPPVDVDLPDEVLNELEAIPHQIEHPEAELTHSSQPGGETP